MGSTGLLGDLNFKKTSENMWKRKHSDVLKIGEGVNWKKKSLFPGKGKGYISLVTVHEIRKREPKLRKPKY